MKSHRTFVCLLASCFVFYCAAVTAGVIWNESADGELSLDHSMPTSLLLSLGSNELMGSTQAGDRDYFSVTVPENNTLSGLFLRSFTGQDLLGFMALQRGAMFVEPPSAPNTANMLGWTHFGPRAGHNAGADLLPVLANKAGTQGFTPPLVAGAYTFWVQQTGGVSNYHLDLVVSPPPPPAWKVNADGAWSLPANWTTGVPNSIGAQATFGGAVSAPRTITVDAPITVGRMNFSSTHGYTIAGAEPLKLDSLTSPAEINVASGSHTISAGLVLEDNLQINTPAANSALTITSVLAAAEKNLAKIGNGNLNLHRVQVAEFALNLGKLHFSADGESASRIASLSIAGSEEMPAAQLDLGSHALVIDYTSESPGERVRNQIVAGRGGAGLGATWTGMGITSRTAAAAEPESRSIGYAENATLPLGPYTSFRGQVADDTALLLAFTRTGDANLDGLVNDDDVTIVSASYAPGVSKPSWALGDFDYNGFVDDDDVTLLGAFYESSPAAASGSASPTGAAAVPEPQAARLFTVGCLLILLGGARHYFAVRNTNRSGLSFHSPA